MLAAKRCRTRVNNVKVKKSAVTPIQINALARSKINNLNLTHHISGGKNYRN